MNQIEKLSLEIEEIIKELPENKTLPDFTENRKFLFETFNAAEGPAIKLINWYYVSVRKPDEPYLFDPAGQVKFCRSRLPYFSEVGKKLRQVRNAIEHHRFLPLELLICTTREIAKLKNSKAEHLVVELLIRMKNFFANLNLKEIKVETPSLISRLKDHFKWEEELTENHIFNFFVTNPNLFVDLVKKPDQLTETLLWFRENGYKEKLKGEKILIASGRHAGKEVVFCGWSGTSVRVKLLDDNSPLVVSIINLATLNY